MLILAQRFGLFLLCRIGCHCCLHEVAVLETNVLYKHVNVSGIVLVQIPSCPQCNGLSSVLMLFDDPWQMIFALMEYTHVILFSDSISLFVGPASTKSSPCVSPVIRSSSWRNRFFELSPSRNPQSLTCSCQSRSQLLAASLVPYMLFFIKPILPASVPILSSTGSRISTGLCAFAWKYARDTWMCMIGKGFLYGSLESILRLSVFPMEETLRKSLADHHF